MKKNMSTLDRIVRLVLVAAMVTLYLTNVVSGTVGIILIVASVILAFTSTVSFCPLYAIFGVSTCPVEQKGS
ncbi:MAG: DUF2892 domain-containing protein [Bacteroidota bacterium]